MVTFLLIFISFSYIVNCNNLKSEEASNDATFITSGEFDLTTPKKMYFHKVSLENKIKELSSVFYEFDENLPKKAFFPSTFELSCNTSMLNIQLFLNKVHINKHGSNNNDERLEVRLYLDGNEIGKTLVTAYRLDAVFSVEVNTNLFEVKAGKYDLEVRFYPLTFRPAGQTNLVLKEGNRWHNNMNAYIGSDVYQYQNYLPGYYDIEGTCKA